ncbi:DUF4012 domain-containing protein [Pengzhenrongella sicca]|uniref:DUF4012 domain-containing protein n=1 Tax=Pengzhenrongella sicca TaxID=2819238 RepID=A0A8A4ZPP1_9MICO|nr:DUF4012 domain-containing protein [Pengzhenrongella sicca]
MTPAGAEGAPRARRRRRGRWVLGAFTVLLVLVLAAAWLAYRGVQAAVALRGAESTIGQMQDDLAGSDTAAVVGRLPGLEDDAATAHAATADPVWRAASYLPVVGANFGAVATVSAALDDIVLATGPVVDQLAGVANLQSLRAADGRLDLAPLAAAAPALAGAATVATGAAESVAAIDTGDLVEQLAGPVGQVQERLTGVSGQLVGAARATALLPPMLGADAPRTYLLLSLNSAELRSAGGIVGAVAELRVDGGAITLVGQRSTVDFPELAEPVLPLTADEVAVHTDRLGRFVQNTSATPDFPRTAALVTQFWRTTGGGEVDGVIATDPVVAAGLLAATGPVVEPGGRALDAGNVLAELLQASYLRYPDPLDADTFYTGVAAAIVDAVGSGQGDAATLVRELVRAGGEHRIRIWSAHPEEQSSLVETAVGGGFLSGGADDAAGIFLDDQTGGKLGYYLTTTATVEDVQCAAASTAATIRLDLAYAPPADIASYPSYVTGYSGTDLARGSIATNLTAYAPVGGTLGSIRVADGVIGGRLVSEGGRQVQVLTSRLAPGESVTYRFEVRTAAAAATVPVWLTPTLTSGGALTATCG